MAPPLSMSCIAYISGALVLSKNVKREKSRFKTTPPAYHEVIEDAFDEEPNKVERSPGEERREDLVGGERPQVGLESQDDDAADVRTGNRKS